MWEEGQHCQRFFEFGPWQRYFLSVERAEQEEQAEKILAEGKAILEAARAKRKIEASTSQYDANPWLRFTQWPQHLAGFQREHLLAAISADRIGGGNKSDSQEGSRDDSNSSSTNSSTDSDDDEDDLAEACIATRRLIRTAFATCRPTIVGRAALEFVNRRETGGVNNEKPFYTEQQVKTVKKYTEHWVKILRYIWRTAEWKTRPKYRLTNVQKKRLERLRVMAANSWTARTQSSPNDQSQNEGGVAGGGFDVLDQHVQSRVARPRV
ncbi:hypothetical protein LTR74_018028 [Friedmanniomyces endolithicus]|nr:hypothetical protein LTR74_018028 [Friedmanniomyces endolithicus]